MIKLEIYWGSLVKSLTDQPAILTGNWNQCFQVEKTKLDMISEKIILVRDMNWKGKRMEQRYQLELVI